MAPRPLDLTGKRFGHLVAIRNTGRQYQRVFIWECLCEACGNTTEQTVGTLQSGRLRSCGCLRTKHSATIDGKRKATYRIWSDMKSRCYNENHDRFKYYGAKGIDVCDEWHEYESFEKYVLSLPNCPANAQTPNAKLGMSIDRIRNNEGYKPGNISWATQTQQRNNASDNRIFTINGVRMTFANAVRKYGKAPYGTIRMRLKHGWGVREAFRTPVNARRICA